MIFENPTYIFIHDQAILQMMENNRLVLQHFPDYKWVFLGYGPVDQIKEHYDNLIVARDYTDNIEQYPRAVAYTGWYVLFRNNLISSPYINLFEYDIRVVERRAISKAHYDIAGFKQLPIEKLFIETISRSGVFDTTVRLSDTWMPTTNLSFRTEIFNRYMEWFHEGCFNRFRDNPRVGHILERFPSYYAMLNTLETLYIPDLIEHFQLSSHNQSVNTEKRKSGFLDYNQGSGRKA